MTRYWKASGETAKQIKAAYNLMNECNAEMDALAKKVGASSDYAGYDSFGTRYAFAFKENPGIAWKKVATGSGFNWYKPSSRKQAKEVRSEFEAIRKRAPGGETFAKIIKMNQWRGSAVHRPGIHIDGGSVYMMTPDYYEPPSGVLLKRVSDVQWEKIKPKKEDDDDSDED